MYQCPACNETISADASVCRFCNLPIDANTAQQLVTKSQQVTTAITQANTFRLSTHAAMLLTGFALFILYMDRGLNIYLVLCPLMALAYGGHWLYRNRSLVTHDDDYPAAIRKVKATMVVWGAVLLVQLAVYLSLNGLPERRKIIGQLPQPLLRKMIDEGDDRPVLSIGNVTALESSPPPRTPSRFPASIWLDVGLKNEGKAPALVTRAVAQAYLPSGDCDFTLDFNGGDLKREIGPGAEGRVTFAGKVNSPCKMSLVLKINVVYVSLGSGLEYTQELTAPALSVDTYQPRSNKPD